MDLATSPGGLKWCLFCINPIFLLHLLTRIGRAAMKTYTLIFIGNDVAVPLKVEIDVADPSSLFDMAERHVTGRKAELWDGSKLVGTISRSEAGLWSLSAVDPDKGNSDPASNN